MGLIKITPKGWRHFAKIYSELSIDKKLTIDMTSFIGVAINAGVTVNTCPTRGRWCEVDSASDLNLYECACDPTKFRSSAWSHDWR